MVDEVAVFDPIDTVVLAAGRNVNSRIFGNLTTEAFD